MDNAPWQVFRVVSTISGALISSTVHYQGLISRGVSGVNTGQQTVKRRCQSRLDLSTSGDGTADEIDNIARVYNRDCSEVMKYTNKKYQNTGESAFRIRWQ